MRAGRMRHRVELQQAGETRDPTGGVARGWSTVVSRWAEIIPLRGQEKFDASQMEAQTNVKIRIRYHSGIDATWRIKHGSTIYNIKSVINYGEQNYGQEIEAMEVLQ